MDNQNSVEKIYKILLLTHITADNLGDQTIEICSNALVRAVMKNLEIKEENYQLISQDAGFVNNRYLSMQSENQPENAEKLIQDADLIIFGGAPMFNYMYEGFAERTAKTLDIIKKYSKPVIFSAIGVENYEEENLKCKRLKKALKDSDVKMITTRDNFEALQKFTEGTEITVSKVSDPAVFSSMVFSKETFAEKKDLTKKKIGLFVIRGGAFKDNRISFGQNEAIKLWKGLELELEQKGYEYEFLTSGSHPDESFLDRLIVEYGLNGNKCITNLNTPEELIRKISSYDGIIACRLHPSIISYSLKVPTVGLVWNDKVSSFYENIGYPNRVITVKDMTVETIIDRLEFAMKEGVEHKTDFLMSSYNYLFQGVKSVLCPNKNRNPFSYTELVDNLPLYFGSDINDKINWKLARIYRTFNQNLVTMHKRGIEIGKNKMDYSILQEKYDMLQIKYNELDKKYSDIIGRLKNITEME